jgi:hypothetical protein
MAADVDIQEYNGVSPGAPTVKNGSTVQFKNVDNAIVEAPLVNPTVRPLGGSIYTYEKVLRLYIDSPGPVNNIDSPRAYGDGSDSMPGGATLRVGAKAAYTQPVKTVSGTATTPWTTYTVASPLALDVFNSGPWSGTDVDVGDFLYMQIELASTAVDPPVTGVEQVVLAYDET